MEHSNLLRRILGILTIVFVLGVFLSPDYAEARGGRSGRSSFGRSRSSSFKSKSSRSKSSFGKKRSSSRLNKNSRSTTRSSIPKTKQSSFGGNRLSNQKAYTSKYGAPRKTSTYSGKNAAGKNQNYVVNNYGGYGSGLMTGYMMAEQVGCGACLFTPLFTIQDHTMLIILMELSEFTLLLSLLVN